MNLLSASSGAPVFRSEAEAEIGKIDSRCIAHDYL
jgi:hypothetical protein